MAKKVENGSKVKVFYTGTLEDGKVFDTNEGKDALEFTVGSKQVVPGFEEAVMGMAEGEEKEVTITPDKAYGERNEQFMQVLPKDKIPVNFELKVGQMLMFKHPKGHHIPAMIKEIKGDEVHIDLNHPLAGKTLKFKIRVAGIE